MKKVFLFFVLAALCAGAAFSLAFLDNPSRTVYLTGRMGDTHFRIVISPRDETIHLLFDFEKREEVPKFDFGILGFLSLMSEEGGEVYEFSLKYIGKLDMYSKNWYAFSLPGSFYDDLLNFICEKSRFLFWFKCGEFECKDSLFYNNVSLTGDIYLCMTAEYFIGDKGPAGGIIVYDCGADDYTYNYDGLQAYEKGWRYIEFVNKYIHLIGKVPSCDTENGFYSLSPSSFPFLPTKKLFFTTDNKYGKENTDKILEAFNAMASKNNQYPISSCAAKLCDELEYNGFDDWYLPSEKELHYALYQGVHREGSGIWTSTQKNGRMYYYDFESHEFKFTRDASTKVGILPFRRF